jgi:hypothetical protein
MQSTLSGYLTAAVGIGLFANGGRLASPVKELRSKAITTIQVQVLPSRRSPTSLAPVRAATPITGSV